MIGTGKQSGKRAQQGGKSSEEDDRASIAAKQILPEPKTATVEPDPTAIAPQDRKSYEPTDLVADVVSNHSAGGRSGNDANNIQFVGCAGVNSGGNECRLTR